MAIGTGVWLGIVLGALILITFIAGMIKLRMNKKKLKRDTEKAHVEAAHKLAEREKSKRPVGEGDLFGVKAIQNGYFGGVAQSRPASPAPSYILAPEQAVVDWGKPSSAASSFVDLPRFPNSRSASPSPLRLQPTDTASLNPSIGVGGTYMPPLPSPRANKSVAPFLAAEKPAGWVSPLDVHFGRPSTGSRPTTPQGPPRPTSYLPKLNFPDQVGKSSLVFSTPLPTFGAKPEESSIVTTELSVPAKSTEATSPSPTGSMFPQSRKARQSNRSFFSSAAGEERPSSRKSNKSFNSSKSPRVENFPSDLPVPLNNLPPQVTTIDPLNFPFDNRQWNTGAAVIRDSIVSKHRVSLFQPGADPQDASSRHSRIQSIAASSIYSSRDSMADTSNQFNLSIPKSLTSPTQPTNPRITPTTQALAALTNQPISPNPPKIPPRSRARSRSTSTHRSTSTGNISRSRDSIRLQRSRASSQESVRSQTNIQKRRSRERDTLHFDPSSSRRNRSGSIKGRNMDFDHPRESPFSNANTIGYATSSHSSNESMSSISTASTRSDANDMGRGNMPLPLFDPSGLRMHPPVKNDHSSESSSSKGKGHSKGNGSDQFRGSAHFKGRDQFEGRDDRPYSHQSQGSIGAVYDSYYRQSVAPRQRSASNGSTGSNGSMGVRRPPPLRMGVVNDTITEMPTPTSAVVAPQERFPRML